MVTYGDTHQVFRLMQDLVTLLVLHRPDDPLSFLVHALRRRGAGQVSLTVPQILLLGPPLVGKTTLAQRLRVEVNAVHVTTPPLLEDQSPHDVLSQQEPSDKLLVKLLHQRLKEGDCFSRGWILDGFPQTRLQALRLQEAGIIPEHVVLLEAPDGLLQKRSDDRMLDSVTGDVYHRCIVPPADGTVAGRLERLPNVSEEQVQKHHREVTGLSSAYQHVLKVISGDQPPADIYQQVLSFVQSRHCPTRPRILLLGPPGSGKSLQAQLLSEKYKLVDVCCIQLVRSVADGSRLGKQIQTFLDDGQAVPDSLVLQVLADRLSNVDCATGGWIVHSVTAAQLQAWRQQQCPPQVNRVFILEAKDEVCMERISLRTTDPASGDRFHAVTQPAPSSKVQNRLQTRPQDDVDTVREDLRQYRGQTAVLQSLYPDAHYIDADQDPHSVFESLESRLTTH